ncbi:GNAT family N-acetyltransferase [Sphingomonas sp. MMS24-J13]|uniref:GNAT family N-acetyltransferase n=1 Tax=Sphingomonas sp. MMS24-J13 TaxID=3238686 RepID=UPI00384C194C
MIVWNEDPPLAATPGTLAAGYALHVGVPGIADYRRLRETSGLTPRSIAAAEAGLPNSFAGVHVRHGDAVIGMGRIVGDGSLFLHIVDIAVDPLHQGRGIGRAIVAALLEHIAAHAPAEVYVSLIANRKAHRLYAQFGFGEVTPDARGMALWMRGEARTA